MKSSKKILFILITTFFCIAMVSCQKSYENNTEILSILKELKQNDSVLLKSFKDLQKQTDSLLKISAQNTLQLTLIKSSLDSALSKLVTIQSQLTPALANIADIKTQLSELLQLYQSLLTLITNIQFNDAVTSLKEGLLAYYSFDNNFLDSSSNRYNGVVTGSIDFATDRNSTAAKSISILSGYISLANTTKLEFTKDQTLTVTGWVYIDDKTNSGRILSSENPEGNLRFSVWQSGSKKKIQWAFGNSGVTTDNLDINTWYHFVYSYNGDGSKVYINGSLSEKNTQINTETRSYAGYRIGQKNASTFDQFYGKIDELKFYNRVLSGIEIKYLASH